MNNLCYHFKSCPTCGWVSVVPVVTIKRIWELPHLRVGERNARNTFQVMQEVAPPTGG